MHKLNVYLILCTIVFISCSKDECEKSQTGLNGKWNLVLYSYCGGDEEPFYKGDIIWEFDTSSNSVTLSYNLSLDEISLYYPIESNEYTYEIVNDSNWYNMIIYFNDLVRYYHYSNYEHVLKLDQGCSWDGPLLLFER